MVEGAIGQDQEHFPEGFPQRRCGDIQASSVESLHAGEDGLRKIDLPSIRTINPHGIPALGVRAERSHLTASGGAELP